MTKDKSIDVLCVGIIVADHVCRPIEAFPPPGGLVLTDGMELTIGGCAANVAADLAKLGRRVAICGCVGNDVFGRHVADSLKAAGIDCRHLQTADCETACTMIVNIAGEDRRFIHTLGANDVFTATELTEADIANARALYVGGYGLNDSFSPRNVVRLFQTAREHDVLTVLDVVLAEERDYSEWFGCVLPLTDIFLPNTDEAALLTGETDPVRQAERFCNDGATTAIVTLGEGGAVLISSEERLRSSAYDVNVVDGTGSGDAFLAGVVHARLNGGDWESCLRHGSHLGAACVQHAGATTGIPTAEELASTVKGDALQIERI